jgi:hydroxyethylthiazole kinase-like uncharacterized protein yjeF
MSGEILRTSVLRAVEARWAHAVPPLMERAGAAAARVALAMLPRGATVLVVAGPGNNGGDAFVVARLLKAARRKVIVVFAGEKERLPPDARAAFAAWEAAGGTVGRTIPQGRFALAIDGLFGIGLTRPLADGYAALVAAINRLDCPVLALDVPSGLDAETGRILGTAVRATHTVTFIALKPGLLTLDGPDHCGTITVATLDIAFPDSDGIVSGVEFFRDCLRERARNTHKGSFGSVGIIGGAPGMAGAALLAGRAALKLGAGRVYVGMLEKLAVDRGQPELMLRGAEEVFPFATALAIGPGLGQSPAAVELLRKSLHADVPLVIDADALGILAAHPVLAARLATRSASALLTPHPAEAARLLGKTVAAVQADRVASALELAARYRADIVLKGCGSVVALQDGRWAINTTGNAGLASAGSGDVLSGITVALLAQGWPSHLALLGAVHLHGAAADRLVHQGIGPIGLAAGELIDAARALLNAWIRNAAS